MLEKQFRFPSQLLAEGHQGHHLQMRSPSVDWADRCLYECKECRPSETFDTHSKVSYHVKKRHLMAMKDYTTRHGRAMVYEEKHTCQVGVDVAVVSCEKLAWVLNPGRDGCSPIRFLCRSVAATFYGREAAFTSTSTRFVTQSPLALLFTKKTGAQVHNRMTMEEYGRLMVNYKDAPAEQQQKQTRQMSYVESNIDWWVSDQCCLLKIDCYTS